MAARQLRKTLRRPTYIVFSFVQPVICVLLFRYVFGGAIKCIGVSAAVVPTPTVGMQQATSLASRKTPHVTEATPPTPPGRHH